MSELRTNRIVPRDGIPSGSHGGIIQVKYATASTQVNQGNTGGAYTGISGLSLDFTPVRADSLIYVRSVFNIRAYVNSSVDEAYAAFALVDNTSGTTLNETGVTSRWGNSDSNGRIQCDVVLEAFVEASSTSARTYMPKVKVESTTYGVYIMNDNVYASGGNRAINNIGHVMAYEISS